MTVRECYEAFGGDYEETLDRLMMEELIVKYLDRFLKDPAYGTLVEAFLAGGERDEEAFRAVHTLKGLCLNLGMTRLTDSAAALTEALRFGRRPEAEALFDRVRQDYSRTADAILQLTGGQE